MTALDVGLVAPGRVRGACAGGVRCLDFAGWQRVHRGVRRGDRVPGDRARRLRGEPNLTGGLSTLLSVVVWFLFGAVLVGNVLADGVMPAAILYALLSVSVVRMVPVALALAGVEAAARHGAFIGWFGPRGLASIAFGLTAMVTSRKSASMSMSWPRRCPDGPAIRRAPRPVGARTRGAVRASAPSRPAQMDPARQRPITARTRPVVSCSPSSSSMSARRSRAAPADTAHCALRGCPAASVAPGPVRLAEHRVEGRDVRLDRRGDDVRPAASPRYSPLPRSPSSRAVARSGP